MSDHLCGAANVTTKTMTHQRFVESSNLVPELAAGETKLAGAVTIVGTKPSITERIPKAHPITPALVPGNIRALGGPNCFLLEIRVQNFIDGIQTKGRVRIGGNYPGRLRPPNVDIFRVLFKQRNVLVLTNRQVHCRRNDIGTQKLKPSG